MKQSGKSREEIMQMISAFRAGRIILTAVEMDLFTCVDKGGATADETAKKARIDPRAAAILMDALTALGFMIKRGGRYSNTESSSRFLVKGKPDYMQGLSHQNHLWESWSGLTKIVKSGDIEHSGAVKDRDAGWLKSFIGAMQDRGRQQAEEACGLIDFSGVSRFLDLAGGSGIFAATFVEKNDSTRAVVFDLPNVVPITKKFLDMHPAGSRVETMTGDYFADDLGSGYDMIFMSAVIHSNSFDENKNLVKRCVDALNPGGRVCILDFVMNDELTEPADAAIFSVNMLVNTKAGRNFNLKEISSWLVDAGLNGIEHKPMSRGLGLLFGTKSR